MPRSLLGRYADWLHLKVPQGRIERGPVVEADGTTRLPGVFVVGDLTGVPLLKFACDSGAAAVARIQKGSGDGILDLVILGGGVAGMAAALEASKRGLSFLVLEASETFSTIANFPKKKPIFTYPMSMTPRGELQVRATVKEELLAELRAQTEGRDLPIAHGVSAEGLRRADGSYEILLKEGSRLPEGHPSPLRARHVIVALGRSGNFRRLDVPGEELAKVSNRLHDPAKFAGQDVAVVGGGDSAMEVAVALADVGARVTLAYRGRELSRPKPENVAAVRLRPVELLLDASPTAVREGELDLTVAGAPRTIPNDAVFSLIGRDPPLDFFRRSGIPILGEMTPRRWGSLAAFLLFCVLLYAWKGGFLASGLGWLGTGDPHSLLGTIRNAAGDPSFYYTLAYCTCVGAFGLRRIRKRKTPYVKRQTLTLFAIQVIPLFLMPQILLPWMGANGWIPGPLRTAFFPGDSWWRAYGLVLAWPLFFWNLATEQPIWGWLILSFVQTCVFIPLLIRRFGKGAYCGWICSCGALAETMGDEHRTKMWHGPSANRWNMAAQGVLAFALVALLWRIAGWSLAEGNFFHRTFQGAFALPWKMGVDLFLAGILGVGLYFWFSGRVWCRTFCPLAALMHIYTKFTRYRIFAEKDKCISCNVCTTVCHQGIDIMGFANKGKPMSDVECVRCSACVQECPTGTLSFGIADHEGRPVKLDLLAASPVQMREGEAQEAILARLQRQHS